jgi:hypothetical protein
MAKLTLTDLANLTSQTTAITQINANGALIEASIENTLSRDGTSPNTMTGAIDMNSNNILNVGTLDATTINLDGISILATITNILPRGAWVTSTAYVIGDLVEIDGSTYVCSIAHTSGTFATDKTNSKWIIFAAPPATIKTPERFSGNTGDAPTVFNLTTAPASEDVLLIFIDGVFQNHDQYSVSGTTITFTTAPPVGSNNIEVNYHIGATSTIPADGSVTTAKFDTSLSFAGITIIGLTVADVIQLESNAAASLPSASTAGGIIYVSDDTGGPTLAFSDGTIWRRVQDRAEISA